MHGSGVGSFESRALPAFTRLAVGGGLEVEVNVGENTPLELRGDDNLFAHVRSHVENGALMLEPDAVFTPTQPLRLALGAARLDSVSAAIGAKVSVHGLKADHFSVYAAGGARLEIDGAASDVTVGAKGVALVELTALALAHASVTVSDVARVRLGYVEKLDVHQRGNGAVFYRGAPELTSDAERPSRVAPAR